MPFSPNDIRRVGEILAFAARTWRSGSVGANTAMGHEYAVRPPRPGDPNTPKVLVRRPLHSKSSREDQLVPARRRRSKWRGWPEGEWPLHRRAALAHAAAQGAGLDGALQHLVADGEADREWWSAEAGNYYRELAHWLRGIAAKCRLPYTQKELLKLVKRYDTIADRIDRGPVVR